MKTSNNQIIHDMHIEDSTQVENFIKLGFEVGSIREEYETFRGTRFGKTYFYIKSADIYFPISKETAEIILAKMARLMDLKKYVEEPEEEMKESERKRVEKKNEWVIYSERVEGVAYTVKKKFGFFECTCPAFKYRKGECKHIKKVKMRLAGEYQQNKLIPEEEE